MSSVCSQCQHPNPSAATHCEACFYPLPVLVACPHCGAAVSSDATFCGQCGNAITGGNKITGGNAIASVELSPLEVSSSPPVPDPPISSTTQLQPQSSSLFHVQTQVILPLSTTLALVRVGKPNERIPPDLDLSGFPHADVVSRVHATIRVEGDCFYLEDSGSANGTYVNHAPLAPGNRHFLQDGDRISFGKGDLVSFIFQKP